MNELQTISQTSKEEITWSKTEIGNNVDLSKVKRNGRHIRVEVYNVTEELCYDYHTFHKFLNDLPAKVGMSCLVPPVIVKGIPENPGLTGIVVIDYSHISFHAFADKKRINFDLYSCKDFDPEIIIEHAAKHFGVTKEDMIVKQDYRF